MIVANEFLRRSVRLTSPRRVVVLNGLHLEGGTERALSERERLKRKHAAQYAKIKADPHLLERRRAQIRAWDKANNEKRKAYRAKWKAKNMERVRQMDRERKRKALTK